MSLILSKSNFTEITVATHKKEKNYFFITSVLTTNGFKLYVVDIETLLIQESFIFDASFEDKLKQINIEIY